MAHFPIGYLVGYFCCVAIAVSAVILNGLFLIALVKRRSLYTPSNALLACLCCSDLLLCVVALPIWTTSILSYFMPFYSLLNLTWLKLLENLVEAFANLSIQFIAMVNLDRYAAILHPFVYIKHATCKLWIIISSCTSAILLFVTIAAHFIDEVFGSNAVFVISIIFYCSIAIIVSFCNWKICKVILKQKQSIASVGGQCDGQQRRYQYEIKRYSLVLILVLMLILCKIPYLSFFLYKRFDNRRHVAWIGTLHFCSDLSMVLNSLLNPLLYYFRISMFRSAMKEVLCCR